MKLKHFNREIRAGLENVVEYSIKLKHDSVTFRASQGSCKGEGKMIYIRPERDGKDTIYGSFYRSGKIVHVGTAVLDVIKPEVFPSFGARVLLKVNLPQIKGMTGIIFNMMMNDFHWEPIEIETYRATILRKGKVIHTTIESSNRFSEDLQKHLDLLEIGDLILISEVKVSHKHFQTDVNAFPVVFEIE
ncbi:MAG: hypothetical protein SFU87_12695 [Chitinophagaceae bacterium]|nr:hypothetical protein [Chitinophagaceae bacterium]